MAKDPLMRNKKNVGSPSMSVTHQEDEEEGEENLSITQLLAKKIADQSTLNSYTKGKGKETGKNKMKKIKSRLLGKLPRRGSYYLH